MQNSSNFQRIFWKLCTHTLTRLKSSFSKTTSHFSSVSSGILLLGLDKISSNFFILLSFSTSVSNNIVLLQSAFLQMSMSFSIGFSEFQQIYKYYEIYTCITISFIYYSYIFIMLLNVLTLFGLKYVAYYTQKFSQQKAWLYKAKLFHELNR